MRLFSFVSLVAAFAGFWNMPSTCGAAESQAADDALVTLPAFTVVEDREQPKWRYISHRDFEILTLAPTMLATELADQLAACMEIMDLVIPPAVRLRLNTPCMFIFDPQEAVALGANGGVKGLALSQLPDRTGRGTPLLNFGRLDQDTYVHYVSVLPRNIDSGSGQPDYLVSWGVFFHLYPSLLAQSNPRPPAWLAGAAFFSGVTSAIHLLHVQDRSLTFSRTPPPRALMPLAELPRILGRLERTRPMTSSEQEERLAASGTARLFARWALFAEDGKYRARFWDFYLRSAFDPTAGEALFQSSFGMNYAEVLSRVAAYHPETNPRFRILFPKSKQSVSPAKIRDATPAEIARITGEWARQAARMFPSQKDRLLAAAGRIFDRGLKDSPSRDPRLLASVGIFRAEMGHDAEALPLLEEAAAGSVARPHAYLEIARIRLAAARASVGEGGKLSAAQVALVLEPLRQAYAQSDQQEQYFDLLTSLWEIAGVKPERADLAPLLEGARLLPGNPEFALRVARLHAAHGFVPEAQMLCQKNLPYATDQKTRDELTFLGRSLANPLSDPAP
jgi:hypothetical protein